MKFLLAALAIASASAAFTCDGTCAEQFYTHLSTVGFEKHKLTAVDAGVYAYIVYNNFVGTEGKNIDLTNTFMAEVGKYCKFTDDTWVRDDVAKCFADAKCDGDESPAKTKESFKTCDDANDGGCSRIMGLMAGNFGSPDCWTKEFPSELTEANKIEGAKVFTVFMAVMGNWETMGTECQTAIITAAGYKEGADVVITIAENADKIIEGAKIEACGYKDGAWDTSNADAGKKGIAEAGKKLTTDVEAAKTEVAKLETKIKADSAKTEASSAAVLSAAVAALAMLL